MDGLKGLKRLALFWNEELVLEFYRHTQRSSTDTHNEVLQTHTTKFYRHTQRRTCQHRRTQKNLFQKRHTQFFVSVSGTSSSSSTDTHSSTETHNEELALFWNEELVPEQVLQVLQTHTVLRVCVCLCLCACICLCIYTYTYTHT